MYTLDRITSEKYTNTANQCVLNLQKVYNAYGYLQQIYNKDNGYTYWTLGTMNEYNQLTQFTSGFYVQTQRTYNTAGLLTDIKTSNPYNQNIIQNLHYDYNTKLQLSGRTDNIATKTETFGYDNNRLNAITGPTPMTIGFAASGNITSKTDAGTLFAYNGTQPHAVTNINNYLGDTIKQNIGYNELNKVANIQNRSLTAQLYYGVDNQRIKMQIGTKTKYYFGNYEKVIDGSTTKEWIYISAYGETFAVYAKQSNFATDSIYFIHKDNLGSYQSITNLIGTVVQRVNYDAWGRLRNANDWTFNNPPTALMFDRGWTGHEHLLAFGLINMNGRVYDPVVGRFLSPDNNIQSPYNVQNYNRYSYCLNNPLMYTDPSGYTWFTQFGNWLGNDGRFVANTAVTIGVTVGVTAICVATGGLGAVAIVAIAGASGGLAGSALSTAFAGGSGKDYLANCTIGAGVGAVSGMVGYGVGGWAANLAKQGVINIAASAGASTISPILNGAVTGVVGGMVGGYAAGWTVGFIMSGGNLSAANKAGINGMEIGGAIGFGTGAYGGYEYAKTNNLNPWTGATNISQLDYTYHYTSSDRIPSIKEYGLKPSSDGFVYTTPDGSYTPYNVNDALQLTPGVREALYQIDIPMLYDGTGIAPIGPPELVPNGTGYQIKFPTTIPNGPWFKLIKY